MKDSYYYRSGERIPVRIVESARVLRDPGERVSAGGSGWPTIPLEGDLVLAVRPDIVEERFPSLEGGALSRLILEHEKKTESLRSAPPPPDTAGSEVLSFPVMTDQERSSLLFPSGDVIAQLPPTRDRAWLEALAERQGWRVAQELSFIPNGYLLSPTGSVDPLAFSNLLVEEHGAVFAHPVFLEEVEERTVLAEPAPPGLEVPASASLFGRQWHLLNTGQGSARAGVDIDASHAWRITRGAGEITIAVIDSGVETGHEVFQAEGKLTKGFNFADDTADPRPSTSSHGTSCAAVAGAAWEGGQVLGVAPGCRIMPIRRTPLGNHLKLAASIAWAVDHGADILSCSFGIDGRPWVLPDVVRLALEHATTRGRGGLGCPIFWAAGNGNEAVSSDEWASSDLVIAVAASTDQGTRASYSDFGPEVDVCAPSSGGANGIVTASNRGYTTQFGGTSAAAPIAAGVAALALSIAPHLRWSEVRNLLARSARRIDPEDGRYDERGHSPLYGFGQVDAFRVLVEIDVPQEIARFLGTETSLPGIPALAHALRQSARGRVFSAHLAARRFGFLQALRGSQEIRDMAARLLPFLADLGARLQAGRTVSIPLDVWDDLERIVLVVRELPPLVPIDEIIDDNDFLEDLMIGDTQTFDSAVEKLAVLFETDERDQTPPPVSEEARKRLEDKARIARQELFLRGMPILTKDKARELELELPEIVRLFKTLRRRPALRQQILEQARRGLQQLQQSTPPEQLQQRALALAEMAQQDLGGEDEREVVVAVVVGGVLIFSAAYNVVKYWGR